MAANRPHGVEKEKHVSFEERCKSDRVKRIAGELLDKLKDPITGDIDMRDMLALCTQLCRGMADAVGRQHGLSDAQRAWIYEEVGRRAPERVHHGFIVPLYAASHMLHIAADEIQPAPAPNGE